MDYKLRWDPQVGPTSLPLKQALKTLLENDRSRRKKKRLLADKVYFCLFQEYGGVETLYVPSERIWLPDIVLYNNAGTKNYNNLSIFVIVIWVKFPRWKVRGATYD